MEFTQIIEQLISEGNLDKAISMLDHEIERHPNDDALWYLRGKSYWRMGRKAYAISDFEEAVHINPESPAVHALELARGIMDFYNPDLLNP